MTTESQVPAVGADPIQTQMIIGGGVSKNADKFIPRLTVRVPVIPAELRNDAGIVGAALVAAERATANSIR